MKRWMGFVMSLMLLSTCSTAPAATVTATWDAPGDDGNVGTATEYDVRYAADSLTLIAWIAATQVSGEPVPSISGTPEIFLFPLSEGTWYVAYQTRDEWFNWSGISNIVRIEIDDTAPAAGINFNVTR